MNSVGFTRGPELEPAIFDDAIVVVESRDAAIGQFPNGAADITAAVEQRILNRADIREIGELVLKSRTGRTRQEQTTVYRSVGVAAQDAAAAGLVLDAVAKRRS